MPQRSTILELPEELRERLHARLVASGFRDYVGHTAWINDELAELGLELRLSKSAVHRDGKTFEHNLERLRRATEQAKALVEGAGDDEGAVGDALVRLVQQRVFDVLMELEVDPEKVNLASLGRMVSELTRASVTQKRWMAEVKSRAAEAVKEVEKIAAKGGFSADTVDAIKRQILGIPG